VRLIADGIVDREGVTGLAGQLGYSERHLNRVLHEELGAGALALARAQRAQTARTLVETTDLTFTEIAYASGFGSIRQFNDTVAEVYASTPTQLRARRSAAGRGVLTVNLAFRSPFDATGVFQFLSQRAVVGVECGTDNEYSRVLRLPNGMGVVTVTLGTNSLVARLELDDVRDVAPAVARLRRLFDLDADPVAIERLLARDEALRPVLRQTQGVRVPGAVDGFEMAVRAIVGQQVSVAGARTVVGRIGARCAAPYASPSEGLTHCFPSASEVADADLAGVGMPTARIATVQRVASAISSGNLVLEPWSEPGLHRNARIGRSRCIPEHRSRCSQRSGSIGY
jgi:AraC family transcriptional regulator of adaptative response / DNA-3-methyladenine glycosylase II